MRHRLSATEAPRRHPCAPLRVAADGALNRAAVLLWPAVYQRNVSLVHLAPAELLGQPAVRFIVLRHHHQPAGGPIQAMHDSRTQFAADCGKRLKVMQERSTRLNSSHLVI